MRVAIQRASVQDLGHKAIVTLLAGTAMIAALLVGWYGGGYYLLPLTERPFHPQHAAWRPAGEVGIRLGLAALTLFVGLYLYPLRKRVKRIQRIGRTRNWLNIHVLLGLTVPVIVTYHSSLKLHGLAGMAYWIMMAIVASGIVGRYLYAQIPRSVTASEISLRELQDEVDSLSMELRSQKLFAEGDLAKVLELPSAKEVASMPLWSAMLSMASLDLRRPWRVAALRRRVISPGERWLTLGGLRPSSHQDLENIIDAISHQSWLTSKILFLNRAGEVFHLWHIVHRPFSYSFLLLVAIHVAMVMLMGYF